MTNFRILGPVEVWAGDQRLVLGGPRQLALLAFLLLHANQAVSSDALIDAVWGPDRGGASKRLGMAVARLRRALEPLARDHRSVLHTVGGGYLLWAAADQLDAALFESGIRAARGALDTDEPARAAGLLEQALALWRGPPMAEVAFEDFAQGEIRRLEELRLVALEIRTEAELQLGRHAAVIGELEVLLAEHPWRERLHAQLMLALYRSGRQAEALEHYRQTRGQLASELGLEPVRDLAELEGRILAQDPTLDAPSGVSIAPRRSVQTRVSAPLPSRLQPYGSSVFADRRMECEALSRALREAAGSRRRAAFVTGEAGIGKTRLVSEIARDAHAAGTLVLAGRCDDGLDLPYQPFVEALEHLVEHAPRDLIDTHVSNFGDSVARLVPALAARISTRPAIATEASESERYVLFGAIDGLLTAACEVGPVLVVLEDLHWADVPTLKLLRRLLTSPRDLPLMLLSTCRLTELAEVHPLRELLADLHREPHVLRLNLGGLSTGDVAQLLRGLAHEELDPPGQQLAQTLETTTGGNPFYITELVRSLTESGALANKDGGWRLADNVEVSANLPVSISETLARRLRRMGDDVKRCLSAAAVLGDEFDLDLVSEVADSDFAAETLNRAVESEVLIEVPGRSARFRFAHALMHRYLYAELGVAGRTELHRRAALALEGQLGTGPLRTAELARHWVAAGEAEVGNALRCAILAGDDALAKLAPDEARRWYQISLELLGRRPDAPPTELCDLLIRQGEAERQTGDRSFRETLLTAADIARSIGYDDGLVRAALANTRGMQSETGIVDEARIGALDAALRIVGDEDSAERAQLLATQAAELMYSRQWDRRVALSDEALAIARRLDDPGALSTVLNMRFVTLLAPETHAERRANAVEAVAVAERLNDPLARFYARHWSTYVSIEVADIPAARSWAARGRELAERFRQPTTLWLASADDANLAIIAGELETADRLAATALEIGRESEPDALACYAAQQTSIAFERGRLGELIPLLEQAVENNPGVPGFRATLALALSEDLCLEEARAILEGAAASSFRDLPYDLTWLAVACIYARVASRLEERSAATTLYEMLAPWDGQVAFPAFGVWGPVGFYLGSLALVLGELGTAARHLTEAARVASRAGAPIWERRATAELTRLAEVAR